jgi:CRP-like cAMP-binding protein
MAAPADFGAWLRVATQLSAVEKRVEAAKAFAGLGEAASELGQVGLAVACIRWLQDNEQAPLGKKLLDAVATTHCRGSKRIDSTLRPTPPAPPASEESAARYLVPGSLDEAIAVAIKAVSEAYTHAMDRRSSRIPPTPLIRVLDAASVRALVGVIDLHVAEAGEVIIDVGQKADALYWVARGSGRVTRGEHELGTVRSNAFFGEIALVGGTTRTAKVTCHEPTWLLVMPASAVEKAAAKAPKLAKVLAHYARARLLSNVMRTSELFNRLSEEERSELLPKFATELVAGGAKVIEKGSDGDRLLVVVQGRCEVRDGASVLATLSVGDGFGEMSLLGNQPAIADVVATEQTVVLSLGRDEFHDVAVKHPALLAEVYKLLVERQQANKSALIHEADDLII